MDLTRLDDSTRPTAAQLNYASGLAEQLGIRDNWDWIEVATCWTRADVSELIAHLKALQEGRR